MNALIFMNYMTYDDNMMNKYANSLRQFLVDNGVDYYKERIGGHNCLVVFNPKIIKHKIKANNITIPASEYDRTIDI